MDPIESLRGAAIVTRAGRVRLMAADGPADAGTGEACTPDTRFQIASVSKQFTAVAALRLAEAGRLDLAEPVTRWLPGAPAQWQRVTLHHLLTHTAGVRHWDDTPGFDASRPMDLAERLALIQQAPLLADPGTGWRYSSPGYVLAGHVVAQAAGWPYAGFLTEAVLAPLGLTATSVGGVPGVAAARGHRDGQPVPSWPLTGMAGTGDLISTVGDLARFTAAVHSGALLGPRSRQAMVTPHAALPEADRDSRDGWEHYDGYGYGVFVGRLGGNAVYLHPGDVPGYQSLVAWLPGPQACVVLLSNDESTDTDVLLRRLVAVAVDGGPGR